MIEVNSMIDLLLLYHRINRAEIQISPKGVFYRKFIQNISPNRKGVFKMETEMKIRYDFFWTCFVREKILERGPIRGKFSAYKQICAKDSGLVFTSNKTSIGVNIDMEYVKQIARNIM